jgi:hypothetical protein
MIYVALFIIFIIVLILFSQKIKIKDDINKVAGMILFYQNKNIKDISSIIHYLKEEEKKIRATFYLPKDMKIAEENNEIIIYYRRLIYNVNGGKYINK